jgi:hypothetical protein
MTSLFPSESEQAGVRALIACVAVSLYHYNVAPRDRALKLHEEFNGACAETDELTRWCAEPTYWATEMPTPTAMAYLKHAMKRYGAEAEKRVHANLAGLSVLGLTPETAEGDYRSRVITALRTALDALDPSERGVERAYIQTVLKETLER